MSSKKAIRNTNNETFISFLKAKEQKQALLIFAAIYLFLLIIIKILVPHPFLTADSGNYIMSAKYLVVNGYRPMGYSWFIRFIHYFSPGSDALFFGQFLFNALAQVSFLMSVLYLFNLRRSWFIALSIIFILSPSLLFCSNAVMSDSLFISLTTCYFVTALWLVKRPNITAVAVHLAILYFVMNVRYTALFYPFLSFILLMTGIRKSRIYLLICLLPFLILFQTIRSTKAAIKSRFDLEEFSGFGGWALANNAVSIIPYIRDFDPEKIQDDEIKLIHKVMLTFPDTVYQYKYINATSFIWEKSYPGKRLLFYNKKSKDYSYVKAWIYTGRQYKDYGMFLIRTFPGKFFRYFILQNFKHLFYSYNITIDRKAINELSESGAKSENVEFPLFITVQPLRIIFSVILWMGFFLSVIYLFWQYIYSEFGTVQMGMLSFLLLFFISYCGFSVFSHPINNFRYLIPVYPIQLLLFITALNKLTSHENK